MTPKEYERAVAALFSTLGKDVQDLKVKHGERLQGSDGTYVIDTTVRYRALGGAEFLVLIEAKRHGRPVERGTVQKLYQIVQSTGAHKGIVASSSGFQQGAVEFADEHGIALVQFAGAGESRWVIRTRGTHDLGHSHTPRGFVAISVSNGEGGGVLLTTLTGQPDYLKALLPGFPSA
jgi:restriction system protein